MPRKQWLVLLSVFTLAICAGASIFGAVRGIIHDPDHRPLQHAMVELHATGSDWSQAVHTNDLGEFAFSNVPIGTYTVHVVAQNFAKTEEPVTVTSGNTSEVHLQMELATVHQEVAVTAEAPEINPESSTTQVTINRAQIAATPGAEQANSLAIITDNVPGAYMVHDQLHIRGGHQVSWLIDGIPVPNTNIATNVGPQFDPKNIDTVEVQTGGYSAEYGDRTYGVFNVVTRSGFESNDQGEILLNYGSFNSTDDQISFGSHTDKFAYFTSLSGNRSSLGLETPVETEIHDQTGGLGQFNSLIWNPSNTDQFRLVTSIRGDHYQIPNDFDQQSSGIADVEDERDAFVNFSWVHTAAHGVVLTLAPFYHFNRADYSGGLSDTPVIPRENRGSNYAGGTVNVAAQAHTHSLRFGFEGFGQHDDEFFSVVQSGGPSLAQRQTPTGDSESLYGEDQWRATPWLTFNGGLRLNRFSGLLTETAVDPRIGAAVQLPRVHWVLRGFYGRYYQPPPLDTVSGPLLNFAAAQGFGFLPLSGERDEQAELGLAIPFRGWSADFDVFRTHARNFFDHDALGNSNIFLPLTIEQARIYGGEATVKSPEMFHRLRAHLAYSHQFAQGRGGVSGGLTDFSPPENRFFFLDHDQRDTLSLGYNLTLPWRSWTSGSFNFGSGFVNGDGPEHLPPHNTFDLSLGKSVGESWGLRLDAMNVGNERFLLDNSNTFGGTHWVNPREISGSVRWKFHY